MAGFMAGFGAGFTRSFEQSREQQAQKESDMFKLKYADYISQRDKIDQWKREDAKSVKMAKSIVAMTGQPQESWTYAFDLIRNGMSEEQVMKQFRENQAIVAPKANEQVGTAGNNPADPREDLTQSAANSVNAQMTASGMQKPQGDGIFGNIQNILKGPDIAGKVNQRIADTAGVSQQQVDETLKGSYQPEALAGSDDYQITWKPKAGGAIDASKVNSRADAIKYLYDMKQNGSEADIMKAQELLDMYVRDDRDKAKNNAIELGNLEEPTSAAIKDNNGGYTGGFANLLPDGQGGMVWMNAEGQPVSEDQLYKYTPAMEKDIDAISKEMGPNLDKYNESTQAFMKMNRTFGDVKKLANQIPEALDISGQAVNTFERYKQAGINIFNVITGTAGTQPLMDEAGRIVADPSMINNLKLAEEKIAEDLKGPLDSASKTALVASLLDVKATMLTYEIAASVGQTGNALSAKEFDAIKRTVVGGGKVEGLNISANDYIQNAYKALKDQEKTLNNGNMLAKNFQRKYRVPSPVRLDVGVDDLINGDPEVKSVFEATKTKEDMSSLNQIDPTKNTDEKVPEGIDPEDWKFMTEEEKRLWR